MANQSVCKCTMHEGIGDLARKVQCTRFFLAANAACATHYFPRLKGSASLPSLILTQLMPNAGVNMDQRTNVCRTLLRLKSIERDSGGG